MKVEFELNVRRSAMLLGAAVIGGAAIYMAFPECKCWPTTSSEFASWVQAVGSVGAILVAIAVPAAQWRNAQAKQAKEELSRALVASAVVTPKLNQLRICAEGLIELLDDGDPNHDPLDVDAALVVTQLASCPLPTDRELLSIASYDAIAGIAVAQVSTRANQLLHIVRMLLTLEQSGQPAVKKKVLAAAKLLPGIVRAIRTADQSLARLNRQQESLNGQSTVG